MGAGGVAGACTELVVSEGIVNCKPGDLAIVMNSKPQYVGMVVTCERLVSDVELEFLGLATGYGPIWNVDHSFVWATPDGGNPTSVPLLPDNMLRPLRGFDPGEETDAVEAVNDFVSVQV